MHYVPLKVTYNFDYDNFSKPELKSKAQETLHSFFGFMRQSFDSLLEIGKALQDFYQECLISCPDGKKVFDSWLDTDFGASKYIASSSMKFHGWFQNIHPRIQDLLRSRIQNWSVSAISLLMKASEEILEELVSGEKKTAAQVKEFIAKKSGSASIKASNDKVSSSTRVISQSTVDSTPSGNLEQAPSTIQDCDSEQAPSSLPSVPTQELGLGVRVVVQNDSTGWNGTSGIITAIGNNDEFWVLLDDAIAQGRPAKHLLKSHQLRLERTNSTSYLTTADIEQIKAEAIKHYQLENAEVEQARFAEIKGAAISDAKKEIASFEKHAQNMEAKVFKLVKQLEEKEQEIARLQSLNVENQRLQQRVTELENALLNASKDSWGSTFKVQAAKVVNKDVENTVAPLMLKIDLLENSIKEKDALIAQMQQNSAPDSDSVISSFGEVGETLGWNGWRRSGYRDSNGTLHKGISAISAFVLDLTREFQQETAF